MTFSLKRLLFFLPISLYTLLFFLLKLEHSKLNLHIFINQKVHPGPDLLFVFLSKTVEGFFIIGLLITSYFVEKKMIIKLIIMFALYGLLTLFFKRIVFADMMRPSFFFGIDDIVFVENVKLHQRYSFPSGHSAEVFALGMFAINIFRKVWAYVFFGIFCTLVAFSRVYLSQHFIEDTVAGAWLGIICGLLGSHLYHKIIYPKYLSYK